MLVNSVSIIGMGALGVLYGQKLNNAMPPGAMRFIASAQRIARYKAQGVFSNGQACHFAFISPEDKLPPADVLIFAVKYNNLPEAISQAQGQIGAHTLVLSLLNGIQSEEDITAVYGRSRVLYCVAQGMDAVKVGNQLNYSKPGVLLLGESQGEPTARVRAVANFFRQAGIQCDTPSDMQRRLWSKFMLNTGVNQVTAIMGVNYGGIQKPGPARQLMIAAMQEARLVAEKADVCLTQADIDSWLELLATLAPEGTSSMAQDFAAKRPSEVELFAGTVLKLGQKFKVATPVNAEIYRKIKAVENAY